MYAIVDIRGHQYKVTQGDSVEVDHLREEEGATVEFSSVLFMHNGDAVVVGTPYIEGAKVKAEVIAQKKDKKIKVFKYKKGQNGNKTLKGHRTRFSVIKVHAIER